MAERNAINMTKTRNFTKSMVIAPIIAIMFVFVLYWFMLPPINPVSINFWVFIILTAAAFIAAFVIPRNPDLFSEVVVQNKKEGTQYVDFPMIRNKRIKMASITVGGLLLIAIILWLMGLPVFNASRYKDLIIRGEGSFTEDIAELSMSQIPVVDRDTAIQLGKRKLGEITDLVSQFEISTDYTQINLKGRPVRVTPLYYADFFKWMNNNKKGIPAYIKVDMVTQETYLFQLENGMKYSPNEYLLRDLTRHIRFNYPTKLFDAYVFEVDESGTPYWIAPTYYYRIGVWGGRDIEGAVLVNAIDGSHEWYPINKIPQWVDRVYRSDLAIQQLNYNGKYQDGFVNSVIGQRGVLQTTSGYNYIAVNDDVYLYTGMTSVTGDQSNVGFVLVNMRTKETKFYSVPGAEEVSAMSSAEGQVQHLKYSSTFPLLLNVADRPTYFMSLKDAAGLVKMYAFVDVARYQIVGTGTSVADARTNYVKALTQEEGVSAGAGTEITGTVAGIVSAVVDGNTNYYITLTDSDVVYVAPIKTSNRLPFIKEGDSITLTYSGSDETREILTIK